MSARAHRAYLDHASMGLPSEGTRTAIAGFVEHLSRSDASGTERSLELFDAVDRARRQAAALVNADPACVMLVENTSRGLGLIASSLPLSAGDNVLICDLEFLIATVAWRGVCKRLGVEVRPVKTQGGRVMVEDFARVADKRTRVIVLSSVQEVTGFRADLRAFRQLAEELGAFLIVDGIQEAGVVPVDLAATPVHAYCAGGSKWLRTPFGAGFLYLHPDLLERLSPPDWGYLALAEPAPGWETYLQTPSRTPFDRLPEAQDIRRLVSGGMPNAIGAVALENSIRELRSCGQAEGMQRVASMKNSLTRKLLSIGARVANADATESEASAILCFGLRQGVEAERHLWQELSKAQIYVSLRYVSGIGGIRVAIHYHNTAEDLQALSEAVREIARL
jgi:cysteine desulfurase / selenocysteine lyase